MLEIIKWRFLMFSPLRVILQLSWRKRLEDWINLKATENNKKFFRGKDWILRMEKFDPPFISLEDNNKWRGSAFQVLGAHARLRCSLSRVSIARKNFTTPPIVFPHDRFLEIFCNNYWKRTLNLIYMKHRVPIYCHVRKLHQQYLWMDLSIDTSQTFQGNYLKRESL